MENVCGGASRKFRLDPFTFQPKCFITVSNYMCESLFLTVQLNFKFKLSSRPFAQGWIVCINEVIFT